MHDNRTGHARSPPAQSPHTAAGLGEHMMTVMFTDIVGFTQLAERMAPAETAAFLAEHLGMLTRHVEAEGGAVDTLLGDGLLASWAGPTAAVRSALAIRHAIEAQNARHDGTLPRLQLRIGLHAGPVVRTALGASGRPLLCGDTLNVARRLEDAARSMAVGEDVIVVASDSVVAEAGDGFRFECLGDLPMRGRCRPVTAFRLAVR